MTTQTDIHVPALMNGEEIVVPQIWLGRDVEYRQIRGRTSLSADEYNREMQLPTLAELRHAYFDKVDDRFVSPEYRESVQGKRGYGEWTSTFLRDGEEAIERPERITYDKKRGLWVVEGGKVTTVELPKEGWVVEYDKPTGLPSRTGRIEDAEKVFGGDASYFYSRSRGLWVVLRSFDHGKLGPFYVHADYEPHGRASSVGGRASSGSEQTHK